MGYSVCMISPHFSEFLVNNQGWANVHLMKGRLSKIAVYHRCLAQTLAGHAPPTANPERGLTGPGEAILAEARAPKVAQHALSASLYC